MLRKYAFINVVALALVGSVPCYAQVRSVLDSMELVLSHKSEVKKADAFVDIALEYVDKNNDMALEFLERGEKYAVSSGDSLSMVLCWRLKGQLFVKMKRMEDASKIFEFALPIAERNGFDRDLMRILGTYGIPLMFKSQYDVALRCFFQAKDMAVAQNDSLQYRTILHNLGLFYYKLGDYQKAILYWNDVSQNVGRKEYLGASKLNMSVCYVNLNDFVMAREYLAEATRIFGEEDSDDVMAHTKFASGYIFHGLKDYEMAEMEFARSYEYAMKQGDVRMILDNLLMLADLCQKRNLIDRAFFYLNDAEKQIGVGVPNNFEVMKIYAKMAELYLLRGEFESAAIYQSKYIDLKDSIYDGSLTASLMRVETDHLKKGHRAEMAAQKEIIQLKEKVIGHQRTLNMVTGLLALLVLISASFIYRNYLRKSNLSRVLDQKVKERTSELENSYTEMLAVVRERDVVIARVTQDVIQTHSTIRGLCGAAKAEGTDEVSRSYFTRIDQVSNGLSQQLESVNVGS